MAEPTPAPAGITMRPMPSFSATRQACSGAAPPKAINVRDASSLPDSDAVDTGGVGHVLVDDLGNPARGRGDVRQKSERWPTCSTRAAAAADGARARCPPANRSGSIRPMIKSASVTVGRRPPRAVAGRTRVGSRAFRAHGEPTQLIDGGDRAAARADLDHVDDGDAKGSPLPFRNR